MRTLKFIVEGQVLKQDPNCDFTNLVPGTNGYLRAEFSFSPDWDGFVKVIGFYSARNQEVKAIILRDGKSCYIPTEATDRYGFRIGIFGRKQDITLKTNKVAIKQNGGAV